MRFRRKEVVLGWDVGSTNVTPYRSLSKPAGGTSDTRTYPSGTGIRSLVEFLIEHRGVATCRGK